MIPAGTDDPQGGRVRAHEPGGIEHARALLPALLQRRPDLRVVTYADATDYALRSGV